MAVLGLSPAVPAEQIDMARTVASYIGIDLREVKTTEGSDPTYVANDGEACLACKTNLYSTLRAVIGEARLTSEEEEEIGREGQQPEGGPRRAVVLYNGTNADDTSDPTRLGLIAASNFRVESPLLLTTKSDVRRASKHLGLPNWDSAASPCLRSRLAMGVRATEGTLRAVDVAERWVREALNLGRRDNMRVRFLAGRRAVVELDSTVLERLLSAEADTNTAAGDARGALERMEFGEKLKDLGFDSYGVRAFRSGSVAAVKKKKGTATTTIEEVRVRNGDGLVMKNAS